MSSQCVIEYDGIFYWCAVDRFLMYNGVVQEIPNTANQNYFFDNLNYAQRQKVWCTKVPRWGEIWWFYPRGDATECTDAIIYNAERSAQRHAAIGYPADKAIVIPNGFDLDAFRPDPDARAWLRAEHGLAPDTPVVGRVARNHSMKDHACLFGAFARVAEAVPAARLAVVGSGMVGDDPALARLAAAAGVADKVLWLGPRRDIERLTAGFDVALSTSSRGEGFPNVMGEAMACGVPMVATDVGDAAAILDDPARIVPPGDAAGLAAIVVRLLQAGPDARAALGVRDRQRALARFSIAAVGDAYAALWARLMPPGAEAPGGGSLHST
jgi:glycosyltransferase involved in cell wall biosynthesis